MKMAKITLTECIHGMFWKTCGICNVMTEKQVKEEVVKMREIRKTNSTYVTVENSALDSEVEADRDYDFDDLNVS